MNIRKYMIPVLASAALFTGCLEKNDLPPEGWSSIVSVEGMTIPGAAYKEAKLNEGTLLEINPEIEYRQGYSESDFTFHWVIGGDTISSSKNLSWVVVPSEKIQLNSNKRAFLWLAVHNAKTQEEWRLYVEANNNMVEILFQSATTPNIGAIVYEKSGNKLEWATVMGNDRTTPANFSELTVDMYQRYNPDREIVGPYSGGSFKETLRIFTDAAPDYGVNIQASDGKTVPMGYYMNAIASEGFEELPSRAVVRKNFYWTEWQEMLVGDQLFVTPCNSTYLYQYLNPNGNGNVSGVAQSIAPIPMVSYASLGIIRKTTGEVYFSEYNSSYGFRTVALTENNGQALIVDNLLGIFKEPATASKDYEIRFFVVAKKGANVNIHEYSMKKGSEDSSLVEVAYTRTVDATAWGGGIQDNSIWFSTATPTARNYAYFTKGKDIYRFSFLELQNPVLVKSFANEITGISVGVREMNISNPENEYYTAVLTYNSSSDKSSVYFIDCRSEAVTQFSAIENTIPGKALEYFPYF